jgi:hypothetical protein
MSDGSTTGVFPLARMCALIWVLTVGLLLLPVLFFATVLLAGSPLALPGVAIVATYAWIWLRLRPTRFAVSADALEVIWPLRRQRIPRREIASVRLIDNAGLRREVGFALRVGAGGLWGGFGWLWSRRRGIVQMYVSRLDGFVWIETHGGRPWLVSPAEPERFVRALSTRC